MLIWLKNKVFVLRINILMRSYSLNEPTIQEV